METKGFRMVRIALWNPYVFQWKLSDFLAKGQKVLRNHYELQRFQNAISELRKMLFPHWKSQENGKSKTRSGTQLFPNGNGILSWQNYKKEFRITAIYNVSRTRFPTCGKWSSPIGKVKKMESRIAF